MRHIRSSIKPIGCFMAIFMLMLFGPFQSAMAAMVGTEALIEFERSQDARHTLQRLLAREDVRNMLVSQGVDLQEAQNRIESLTDEEAIRVAEQLQELPATQMHLQSELFCQKRYLYPLQSPLCFISSAGT